MACPALTVEGELMKQLKLLPRILVRVAISVKIAISIRRR
jgi:hypothetical protein